MKAFSAYLGVPGLVFLIFGAVLFLFVVQNPGLKIFQYVSIGQMILGLILVVIYLVHYIQDLFKSFTRSKTMIVGTLGGAVVLGILILVNVVANTKLEKRFDMTEQGVYSLASDSVNLVKNLQSEVQVTGFFSDGGQESEELKDLIDLYRAHTDKIKFSVVDPDKNPDIAKQLNARSRDVVVENPSRKKNIKINKISEQEISSAIKKVAAAEQRTVCLTTGFGERDLNDGQTREGFAFGKEMIEREGHLTETINLAEARKISEKCDAMILVGPEKGLTEPVVALLTQYYDEGGKLMLLLDPVPNPQRDGVLTTGFEAWLSKKGVELTPTVVLEAQQALPGIQAITPEVISGKYGSTPITASLGPSKSSAFLFARALILASGEKAPRMIVTSRAGTWAETRVAALFQKQENPDKAKLPDAKTANLKGELVIGALVEEPAVGVDGKKRSDESALIVFGDSDFASNGGFQQGFNLDLFLNSLSYLAGQDEGLSIRPRQLRTSTISMSADQYVLIFFLSVFLLPQLIIIFGSTVWTARRRR